MFKHILIPTDGSELAGQAVDKGVALAASLGAAVTIVTVTEPFHILSTDAMQVESSRSSYDADAAAYADRVLKAARAKAEAAGVRVQTHHKWHDDPWQAIIDTALEEGCDLIAMASHGRRGVAAVVMGSQATRILTHSKIPVLVYR
ncbi:Putative universal stress protein [Paracoccus haematequi]|uniref:Universal stress protein n=1 Tax=Paracoccus haematequi TaxID=2491866 RepID=A0A3S4CFW1_9RHOB|nr:universal stress protein [Paracoccus haematequi]VDS07042.1 Putative universal stress protein [Paracoccus haematequi]